MSACLFNVKFTFTKIKEIKSVIKYHWGCYFKR